MCLPRMVYRMSLSLRLLVILLVPWMAAASPGRRNAQAMLGAEFSSRQTSLEIELKSQPWPRSLGSLPLDILRECRALQEMASANFNDTRCMYLPLNRAYEMSAQVREPSYKCSLCPCRRFSHNVSCESNLCHLCCGCLRSDLLDGGAPCVLQSKRRARDDRDDDFFGELVYNDLAGDGEDNSGYAGGYDGGGGSDVGEELVAVVPNEFYLAAALRSGAAVINVHHMDRDVYVMPDGSVDEDGVVILTSSIASLTTTSIEFEGGTTFIITCSCEPGLLEQVAGVAGARLGATNASDATAAVYSGIGHDAQKCLHQRTLLNCARLAKSPFVERAVVAPAKPPLILPQQAPTVTLPGGDSYFVATLVPVAPGVRGVFGVSRKSEAAAAAGSVHAVVACVSIPPFAASAGPKPHCTLCPAARANDHCPHVASVLQLPSVRDLLPVLPDVPIVEHEPDLPNLGLGKPPSPFLNVFPFYAGDVPPATLDGVMHAKYSLPATIGPSSEVRYCPSLPPSRTIVATRLRIAHAAVGIPIFLIEVLFRGMRRAPAIFSLSFRLLLSLQCVCSMYGGGNGAAAPCDVCATLCPSCGSPWAAQTEADISDHPVCVVSESGCFTHSAGGTGAPFQVCVQRCSAAGCVEVRHPTGLQYGLVAINRHVFFSVSYLYDMTSSRIVGGNSSRLYHVMSSSPRSARYRDQFRVSRDHFIHAANLFVASCRSPSASELSCVVCGPPGSVNLTAMGADGIMLGPHPDRCDLAKPALPSTIPTVCSRADLMMLPSQRAREAVLAVVAAVVAVHEHVKLGALADPTVREPASAAVMAAFNGVVRVGVAPAGASAAAFAAASEATAALRPLRPVIQLLCGVDAGDAAFGHLAAPPNLFGALGADLIPARENMLSLLKTFAHSFPVVPIFNFERELHDVLAVLQTPSSGLTAQLKGSLGRHYPSLAAALHFDAVAPDWVEPIASRLLSLVASHMPRVCDAAAPQAAQGEGAPAPAYTARDIRPNDAYFVKPAGQDSRDCLFLLIIPFVGCCVALLAFLLSVVFSPFFAFTMQLPLVASSSTPAWSSNPRCRTFRLRVPPPATR